MHKDNLSLINDYEVAAWQGGSLICGIDEVGRGCLAGPMVLAGCILPAGASFALLKDSKLLSSKQRNEAMVWINRYSVTACVTVSPQEIDAFGMTQATIIGVRQVLHLLSLHKIWPLVSLVLCDYMAGKNFEQELAFCARPIVRLVRGESASISIAGASIVAKEFRDQLLRAYDQIYPGYGWANNVGYATKDHMAGLTKCGPTVVHRQLFLRNFFKNIVVK